jgi:hypothetical protein
LGDKEVEIGRRDKSEMSVESELSSALRGKIDMYADLSLSELELD